MDGAPDSAFGIPVDASEQPFCAGETVLKFAFRPDGASPEDLLEIARRVLCSPEGERRSAELTRSGGRFSVGPLGTDAAPSDLVDVFPGLGLKEARRVIGDIRRGFGT